MAIYQNLRQPSQKKSPGTGTELVAAVWSRDVDASQLAGRPRIIMAVRKAMAETGRSEHLRLTNLLERRTLGAILWAGYSAIGDLFQGRLPSFQCLLFSNGANHRELRERIRELKPTTLYCDGVRSYYFLRRLGKERARMRIVIDLDDLMSRRMELLGRSGLGLSLGYLHRRAPGWVVYLLTRPLLARLVAAWESTGLRRVEDDFGQWAETVVLVSSVEGRELASRYAQNNSQTNVVVIPPPIDIAVPPQTYTTFGRFIFIGTDTLPQNHATIAWLLDLWRSLRPACELHIFGHMSHQWGKIPGVHFQGYAPSLADVYTEGAVLLAPGALRGGVKTKVIEAFANGCAVAGNAVTFEGLELDHYPLHFEEEAELAELILNPEGHLAEFAKAAALGQRYAAKAFSFNNFSAAWLTELGAK